MAASKRKVKLVCSYGGKLQPSPIGNKLIYCGGDSRLIIVDRSITFDQLLGKLSSACRVGNCGSVCVGLKYQLPGEDLNLLVSLTNGDDLDNMMFEYDRMHRNFSSVKTVRIRLFLDVEKLPSKPESEPGAGFKSESSSLNPDYLFGFDKEEDYCNVCDEHALEEWKIPREQNPPKPKAEDEAHVAVQPENRDVHATCAGAAVVPSMYFLPPVSGWGIPAPAYIIVAAPAVPGYCVL